MNSPAGTARQLHPNRVRIHHGQLHLLSSRLLFGSHLLWWACRLLDSRLFLGSRWLLRACAGSRSAVRWLDPLPGLGDGTAATRKPR